MKRRTHEEFVKEIYDLVGEEYTVLNKFKNTDTKILMRHNCSNCDNNEWEIRASSFLGGTRCPKCVHKNRIKDLTKTHEKFVEEVKELTDNTYVVLGEYKKSQIKIKMKHICEDCNNYEYEVAPNDFLKGTRCPKCSGMMKKTTESFKEELYNLVGNEYEVLNNYINNKVKIKIKHKNEKCEDYIWDVRPSDILQGARCPKCAGLVKTHDDFIQEVYDLVGNDYKILGTYTTNKTKILVKHNCDYCENHEWYVTPANFLNGTRCPICGFKAISDSKIWSNEDFIKRVYEIHKDEYKVIGNYTCSRDKIKIKHISEKCHNHEWDVEANSFIKGSQCPVCCSSHGEKVINKFLSKNSFKFKRQFYFNDCKDERILKFDFAIFDKNNNLIKIIEYNGIQHYEPVEYFGGEKAFKIQQRRDNIKREYCKNNNIELLEIPYWDFDIIEYILKRELLI